MPKRANLFAQRYGHSPADLSKMPRKLSDSKTSFTFLINPRARTPVSDDVVSVPLDIYSGSIYANVPLSSVWWSMVVAFDRGRRRQRPKSPSLATKFPSRRMLLGFRSPWTTLFGLCECRKIKAEQISVAMRIRACQLKDDLPFQRGTRPPMQPYSSPNLGGLMWWKAFALQAQHPSEAEALALFFSLQWAADLKQ
ncbi:hypothetical protein Taro_010536, partial [Colocasia esculenta]|nr:hypothetical protein [Colocasia esculenta]